MLNTKLEALSPAVSVWIKHEFLVFLVPLAFIVSPVTSLIGDRVSFIDTCVLPLNDELWDGNKRPLELLIHCLWLRILGFVKFSVKCGSNWLPSKLVLIRYCKAIRTASTITSLYRWDCWQTQSWRARCCIVLLHADMHRQPMALHLSMNCCIIAL